MIIQASADLLAIQIDAAVNPGKIKSLFPNIFPTFIKSSFVVVVTVIIIIIIIVIIIIIIIIVIIVFIIIIIITIFLNRRQ